MFRELAVFLMCFASIVSASHVYNGYARSYSTTGPPLEVSRYQPDNAIPIESKIIQAQLAQILHSPDAYSTQRHIQYQGPANVQVWGPKFSYDISPAVVKTISASVARPVANKVTVEAYQQAIAHPPTATYVTNYDVSVAAESVQHVQTIEPPNALPVIKVTPKPIVSVTVPPTPTIVTSTLAPQPANYVETVSSQPAIQYAPVSQDVRSEVVNTVSAVPVEEKKVTIEAHQSVTAHPPSAPRHNYDQTIVDPSLEIVASSVAQIIRAPLPVTSRIVQETVTAQPPATYITSTLPPQPVQHIQPIVDRPRYVSGPVQQVKRVYTKAKPPVIEGHRSVTVHPPTPVVQQVQRVVNPAPVPYVSSPATYPVSSTVVNQETGTLVQHATSQVHYAPPPAPQPIPVPVIYTAEEAPNAQYVTKYIQSAPAIISRGPVAVPQPIVVPNNAAYVRYNSDRVSSPVVYHKTFASQDHVSADLVATRITPGYGGYARAVTYSPASAVSRVSFNGLGVSYGW